MPISVKRPRNVPAVLGPLREIITATLALEGLKPGEITVVLADDATSRDLNRRWRGIDRATDVLSFGYGTARGRASGDLVISLERSAALARRYRVPIGRELARLVIHGTLHIAGHDHHRIAERRRMRGRERAALRARPRALAQLGRFEVPAR